MRVSRGAPSKYTVRLPASSSAAVALDHGLPGRLEGLRRRHQTNPHIHDLQRTRLVRKPYRRLCSAWNAAAMPGPYGMFNSYPWPR